MLSFREVLFFKNFSYNFCFPLDDFKTLWSSKDFAEFFLTEIVLRGNARSYIPEIDIWIGITQFIIQIQWDDSYRYYRG